MARNKPSGCMVLPISQDIKHLINLLHNKTEMLLWLGHVVSLAQDTKNYKVTNSSYNGSY